MRRLQILMYTGHWTGTMLLTEPEAGSDLSALTTSAVKNQGDTFSITGNKIRPISMGN